MKPIKLVYFGTPDFSGQILESLIKNSNINVVGVVTKTTASLVIKLADKHNIPIFKPNILDQSNLEHIKLLNSDIFLVAAYGQIIPQSWLDTPQIATLNIHFSLLPKYRGALCVSEAIKNQDQATGVTLMQLDKDLDHGPIITQKKLSININDNVATLTQKLTRLAISLLSRVQPAMRVEPVIPQDHSKATYTPMTSSRTRQSAFIKTLTTKNPKKIHALIRSLNPDPGAWTIINGQEIKILETKLKDGQLEIITVQLPGKTPISWQQFTNRYQLSKTSPW